MGETRAAARRSALLVNVILHNGWRKAGGLRHLMVNTGWAKRRAGERMGVSKADNGR